MEERLDKVLVQRGLVTSRTRGEELIENGDVLVNGKSIDKPGKKIPVDAEITLLNEEIEWVSRGALKLLGAFDAFNLDVTDKTYIDLGASTGGFTEVLLSKGVTRVYCVDVGHGQLHERIKSNAQVVNIEKTHVRELTKNQIPELVDGIVIDVSFISLGKVLPFIQAFAKEGAFLTALIKPQFELDKKQINKHGIVRSSLSYPKVIENVKEFAEKSNFTVLSISDSPILGGDGNKEFLLHAVKN